MTRRDQLVRGRTPRVERGRELLLERRVSRRRGSGSEPLDLRGAEEQRRRREDVEDEDEHAEQQHQQLQRNLPVGAHQQRMPCFVHRLRRQVALDLALIGAEVRQKRKSAAIIPDQNVY